MSITDIDFEIEKILKEFKDKESILSELENILSHYHIENNASDREKALSLLKEAIQKAEQEGASRSLSYQDEKENKKNVKHNLRRNNVYFV